MQYSYYHYSSNTNPLILFFVKKDDLIFINIKYEDYDKAYYKQKMSMVITEEMMKENQELWLYYIRSLLLTNDTSNGKNIKYKMLRKMMISKMIDDSSYSIDVEKSVYISPDYCDSDIYDVNIPNVFTLSNVNTRYRGLDTIEDVYYESDRFYPINVVNQKIIEMKLLEIEEIIAKCEMNVEKIKALDNIVPENFPKDIYDIIYKKIFS
jgi:hypothetical protein